MTIYNENAEFESDAPTVRVKNLEELGTMARVKLDILEFFQDKFAKVIYVQRQIEKGRGRRVFREQDYDMALALFDGKAAARLRQVDAFMEDVAEDDAAIDPRRALCTMRTKRTELPPVAEACGLLTLLEINESNDSETAMKKRSSTKKDSCRRITILLREEGRWQLLGH